MFIFNKTLSYEQSISTDFFFFSEEIKERASYSMIQIL